MKLYDYQRSRSYIDLGPNHSSSIFLNFFSNHLAYWSQILCGVSLELGNESLFNLFRSHDQNGHHAHIWQNPLKSSSLESKGWWPSNCRCSQLKQVHEALWVPKVRVIHWLWSNSIRFNIYVSALQSWETYCFCLGRPSVRLSVRHKIVSAL